MCTLVVLAVPLVSREDDHEGAEVHRAFGHGFREICELAESVGRNTGLLAEESRTDRNSALDPVDPLTVQLLKGVVIDLKKIDDLLPDLGRGTPTSPGDQPGHIPLVDVEDLRSLTLSEAPVVQAFAHQLTELVGFE